MSNLTVIIPDLNPEGTYYLCNVYGEVATLKGNDISIRGYFVTENGKTEFKIYCTHEGKIYPIEKVKVKNGCLLVQAPTMCHDLRLSWYNSAIKEHVTTYVMDDLSLACRGVWVCKDYEPKHITKATEDELILPYNDYTYDCGIFYCNINSLPNPNNQVYSSGEEVQFYCRCSAVSDKSMAQHVRLTDEQLDEINARIKNLTDYCKWQGIALVYDNDDGILRAYKFKDLPEGYYVDIDARTNNNPQSMTVPWSGLRRIDIEFGYVNSDWMVHLNYTEHKKEE